MDTTVGCDEVGCDEEACELEIDIDPKTVKDFDKELEMLGQVSGIHSKPRRVVGV